MRLVLILMIAMALTISWQSTVLAGASADRDMLCADEGGKKEQEGKKKGAGDEEPECE